MRASRRAAGSSARPRHWAPDRGRGRRWSRAGGDPTVARPAQRQAASGRRCRRRCPATRRNRPRRPVGPRRPAARSSGHRRQSDLGHVVGRAARSRSTRRRRGRRSRWRSSSSSPGTYGIAEGQAGRARAAQPAGKLALSASSAGPRRSVSSGTSRDLVQEPLRARPAPGAPRAARSDHGASTRPSRPVGRVVEQGVVRAARAREPRPARRWRGCWFPSLRALSKV